MFPFLDSRIEIIYFKEILQVKSCYFENSSHLTTQFEEPSMPNNLVEDIATDKIRQALVMYGVDPSVRIELRPIPFEGTWGFATSISYQLASSQVRAGEITKAEVPDRVIQISEQLAHLIKNIGGFQKVEAIKGYVNLYFNISEYAKELVIRVLREKESFGQGSQKKERVMVEYSQPNTHKAFHVGHLRNVCLGSSLYNILTFAGFDTVGANYIGDIGSHVIKCLWAYKKFYSGQEPETQRGRWLGQIYSEADIRLGFRKEVESLLNRTISNSNNQFKVFLQDQVVTNKIPQLDADKLLGYLNPMLSETRVDEEGVTGSIQGKDERTGVLDKHFDSIWNWIGETIKSNNTKTELVDEYNELNQHVDWWSEVVLWNSEIKSLFREWEDKNPELMALWERTKAWSMEEFLEIYKKLGVEFDIWFYESQVEEEGKLIVDDMVVKGIAEDLRPSGPVLVRIDEQLRKKPEFIHDERERNNLLSGKDIYRSALILRSDGTSLYSTKDLSLARRKFEDYKVERSIHVVDVRQSMYFQQVFKILEIWGFKQAQKCYHLAYEIVTLPDGTMSSRAGKIVLFEDFFQEALDRAYKVVAEKNPSLDNAKKREIAQVVAIGAIKYSMLSRDNNRMIVFNFDEALNYEGQAAPYIQYACARASRILEKANLDITDLKIDFSHLQIASSPSANSPENVAELNLLSMISKFPSVVEDAAQSYKPALLCGYLFELAQSFSNFYHQCDVLRGDIPIRIKNSRLALTQASRQTIANGLRLLGISAPEVM